MRAVSDEMVLTLSAAGTADDVPARISALLKVGLKQAALSHPLVDLSGFRKQLRRIASRGREASGRRAPEAAEVMSMPSNEVRGIRVVPVTLIPGRP